jgi:polyisoprenoid-binding protein YceI
MLTVASLTCAGVAFGQPVPIDTAKSTMTVRVYKSGALAAFGHDHEISAPIARGSVDAKAHSVELHVTASALRVNDAKASDKDRGEIQTTMLGPEVLDAQNNKEIAFQSTGVQEAGAGAWKVSGNLTLRGQTHPVSIDVRDNNGHYTGAVNLKISDFGIKQVKAAGGTVTVKDEVRIEFDIQLAH